MQTVKAHMPVLAVNDLRVGEITAVRDCCFDVQLLRAPGAVSLKIDSIFSVDAHRVTLLCGVGEIQRYRCALHHS
jgi:hypothetical protein